MEHTLASSLATFLSSPPASDTSPVIPALNLVAITQKELTRLKWEGGYWKAQQQRAIEREARLKKEIEQKKALIRDLQHRLFGKKSETGTSSEARKESPAPPVKRPRGQQKGSPVPGAAYLIFLFPAMKKRISLKLRLRRTAAEPVASAIIKAVRVSRRRMIPKS